MITTITFNPAIDKRYQVSEVSLGQVNRVDKLIYGAGGKGINCTRVISQLGYEVTATGFLGGFNGEFILHQLEKMKVNSCFTRIHGETRICIAVADSHENHTEFLEPGPTVQPDEYSNWLRSFDELLDITEAVTMSGSLPKGLAKDTYKQIITRANNKGVKCFLDTSGEALLHGVEAKPYFIKPNSDEISYITGKSANSIGELANAIKELLAKGVSVVTVSLGGEGSLTGYKNKLYKAVVPKIDAVNPVGSGDSFTAGMAIATAKGMGIKDAIAFSSACGTANALEDKTGYVNKHKVEEIFREVQIIEL